MFRVFLFIFFFFLICVCIPWVWLGWRWCEYVLMHCSTFRNFTFCFYWFLLYFRLLIYICVLLSVFPLLCLLQCLFVCLFVLLFYFVFIPFFVFIYCLCYVTVLYQFFFESICSYGVAQGVMSLDLTTHTSLSPIRRGFAPSFVNYKKGCTRLAAASDKVYLLLVQGRWFSPASSTTKTFRQNIAEILLKVTLSTQIHSFFSYAKRFMCFR
jgi:hypothetical protein